jgi:hypothetical protein
MLHDVPTMVHIGRNLLRGGDRRAPAPAAARQA